MSLTLQVYASGITEIVQAINEISGAGGLRFATGYPGGLYLDGSLTIQRQVLSWSPIKLNQRVVIRDGLAVVYEGWIDGIEHASEEDGEGIVLNLVGAWGRFMMRRHWNKPWADQEITEAKWPVATGHHEDKFTLDRYNRLMAIPKDGVSFAIDDYAAWQYTAPAGETIKRVVFNYALAEGAQAWQLVLYDVTNSFADWTVSSSGTGTQDETLSTPANSILFMVQSKGSQTGIGDGSIYGRFSGITVYTETGSINLTEIAKDIRAEMAELNSDDGNIGSNTLDLTPFTTAGFETMADILTRACDYGDSSNNRWAAQLWASDQAATPNGEPVLAVSQYPALTDYDYTVRLSDDNLVAPVQLTYNTQQLANWIIVQYSDSEGSQKVISPDDEASLTDATSVAAYGQREKILVLGQATATEATNAGKRYLAAYKEPLWEMTNPITVKGWIRAKLGGGRTPAAQIRAGKRVKIEDYPLDLSGSGLIFLISHTEYDDDSGTCSIQAGPPPDLIYATSAAPVIVPADPVVKTTKKGK